MKRAPLRGAAAVWAAVIVGWLLGAATIEVYRGTALRDCQDAARRVGFPRSTRP